MSILNFDSFLPAELILHSYIQLIPLIHVPLLLNFSPFQIHWALPKPAPPGQANTLLNHPTATAMRFALLVNNHRTMITIPLLIMYWWSKSRLSNARETEYGSANKTASESTRLIIEYRYKVKTTHKVDNLNSF
jgi:hypothetical protein